MVKLGVDYGDKRVGIAVCDSSEILASGVDVIKPTGMHDAAKKIAEAAVSRNAGEIIIGFPLNMNGTEGESAKKVRLLKKMIEETGVECEVILSDERLTTTLAHIYLNETNIARGKRKAVVDKLSAQIILQNYIDGAKNKDRH